MTIEYGLLLLILGSFFTILMCFILMKFEIHMEKEKEKEIDK
jgi:hypothetical protein